MTYYEELGLKPGATQDEIREAYRHLVRVLHPDRLQDDKQRALAECQMKRLNKMYETLIHSDRRRIYDLSLITDSIFVPEPIPPPPPPRRPSFDIAAALWGVGGALFAIILMAAIQDTSRPVAPVAASAVSEKPAVQPGPRTARTPVPANVTSGNSGLDMLIANLRQRIHQAERERDEAVAKFRNLQQKMDEQARKPAAPVVEPAVTPVPPPPEAPPVAEKKPDPPPGPNKGFGGMWYFVRQTTTPPTKELYPPEFIEAIILEENGALRGRYRARYKVSDRAISPEVMFQFSGRASKDSAVMSWQGVGGAKGEVRIRLVSANTLEVAWVASDLGRNQGLGYGTATLIRRQDP